MLHVQRKQYVEQKQKNPVVENEMKAVCVSRKAAVEDHSHSIIDVEKMRNECRLCRTVQ